MSLERLTGLLLLAAPSIHLFSGGNPIGTFVACVLASVSLILFGCVIARSQKWWAAKLAGGLFGVMALLPLHFALEIWLGLPRIWSYF